jgi:hypothetical protein
MQSHFWRFWSSLEAEFPAHRTTKSKRMDNRIQQSTKTAQVLCKLLFALPVRHFPKTHAVSVSNVSAPSICASFNLLGFLKFLLQLWFLLSYLIILVFVFSHSQFSSPSFHTLYALSSQISPVLMNGI